MLEAHAEAALDQPVLSMFIDGYNSNALLSARVLAGIAPGAFEYRYGIYWQTEEAQAAGIFIVAGPDAPFGTVGAAGVSPFDLLPTCPLEPNGRAQLFHGDDDVWYEVRTDPEDPEQVAFAQTAAGLLVAFQPRQDDPPLYVWQP